MARNLKVGIRSRVYLPSRLFQELDNVKVGIGAELLVFDERAMDELAKRATDEIERRTHGRSTYRKT